VSFLNQLKSEASNLQRQRGDQHVEREQGIAQTQRASLLVLHYFDDLARQLNILEPAASSFSLDGKTAWPPMKLTTFRVDARRKLLNAKEVIDTIAMGWDIVPQGGAAESASLSVNFPPDLERVEARLSLGMVKHDRVEVRHPEKNSLLALRFDYVTQTRGSVMVSADHEKAELNFRMLNTNGFGVAQVAWGADRVDAALMDELAKLVVSQPSRFV
jgi:hypothetical protein